MSWSWVHTQYSIHRVKHTPSTVYTVYCIHRVLHQQKIDSLPLPASLSSAQRTSSYSILCIDTIISQPTNWVSASIEHASRSTASRFTTSRFTASRLTAFQLNCFQINLLQVLLQCCFIMASKCISQHAQLRLPSASQSALDLGLQLHLQTRSITTSKSVSEFTGWQPLIESLCPLELSVSKCIPKFTWSRSPSASLSSLDLSLQVHLQTLSITASKYILKTRWRVNRDTAVTEVDRVMGCIYLAHRVVHRHYLISISSYHTMKIPTVSFPTVILTRSFRDFIDPCNCVDPQRLVVSHLLSRFLPSSNQIGCSPRIPFGCSICMSRCPSNYAWVPSAARSTLWIYMDRHRYCMPYYDVANDVTETKMNMIRRNSLWVCTNHCCNIAAPSFPEKLRTCLGCPRMIPQGWAPVSASLDVSRRSAQRCQELQNFTIL